MKKRHWAKIYGESGIDFTQRTRGLLAASDMFLDPIFHRGLVLLPYPAVHSLGSTSRAADSLKRNWAERMQ